LTFEVKVAFPVKYKLWYEPIYISKQGSAPFDERYLGYGMTRNTQVLEMALADYKFFLLDSIFLSHLWGFQRKDHSNKARIKQTRYNHRMFSAQHARELAARYIFQNIL